MIFNGPGPAICGLLTCLISFDDNSDETTDRENLLNIFFRIFATTENTILASPSFIHAMFYRYINYSCPNPDDDHISLAVRRRQPDQTLDAGHRSCIRHSAAAAGVVLARRAVRLEVLVVVLLGHGTIAWQ